MDDVALPSPKFATVRVRHDACVNRTASHVNWDAVSLFVSRSWITRYRPSTRVASRFLPTPFDSSWQTVQSASFSQERKLVGSVKGVFDDRERWHKRKQRVARRKIVQVGKTKEISSLTRFFQQFASEQAKIFPRRIRYECGIKCLTFSVTLPHSSDETETKAERLST